MKASRVRRYTPTCIVRKAIRGTQVIGTVESAARVAEELHALDVQLGHADSEAKLLTEQQLEAEMAKVALAVSTR
jgi:hypothetical protein